MFNKKILILITFLTVSFSNIAKVYSIGPEIFIQSTVNRAAKTLSGNFTKGERVEKLKEIARDTVDIRAIGFYSLGSYRKNLSNEKIEKYQKIFAKYFSR